MTDYAGLEGDSGDVNLVRTETRDDNDKATGTREEMRLKLSREIETPCYS